MKDLTILTQFHRNQLESELPWVWLYELETTDVPARRYRLTNFTEAIEFGTNAAGERLRYAPAKVIHSDIDEPGDGSLASLSITFGNVGAVLPATIDAAGGWTNQPIRISLVSLYDIENENAAVREEARIVSCSMTRDTITFGVSAFDLYQLAAPALVYARRGCRFSYGDSGCGVRIDAPGLAFPTCGGTLNECRAIGDDELARGVVTTRQHPKRFGGFPGAPRAKT